MPIRPHCPVGTYARHRRRLRGMNANMHQMVASVDLSLRPRFFDSFSSIAISLLPPLFVLEYALLSRPPRTPSSARALCLSSLPRRLALAGLAACDRRERSSEERIAPSSLPLV